MLMLLGVSTQLADAEVRRTATTLCMRGFRDMATVAGTRVTGGQTVRNPWYLVGGVASAVVAETNLIRWVHRSIRLWRHIDTDDDLSVYRPESALAGDVLILTKPLGTQPAVMAYGYLVNEEKRQRLGGIASSEESRRQ